jgi:hypothetical protein
LTNPEKYDIIYSEKERKVKIMREYLFENSQKETIVIDAYSLEEAQKILRYMKIESYTLLAIY